MKKEFLSKTLSFIIIISAILSGLLIFLTIKGFDVHSKSGLVLLCAKFSYILFLLLFFGTLIIKSSITAKTGWTKWICISIGGLMLIVMNIGVANKLPNDLKEWIITGLFELLFLPFLLFPLLIKKSYWTKWLLVTYSFIGFIISTIILIVIIDNNLKIEVESYITYKNQDNQSEYIAMFTNVSDTTITQQYFVERYPLLIKKRPFTDKDLTGKWMGYNDMGEVISDCIYDEGRIIQSNPIIPKDAILVKTSRELKSAIKIDSKKIALLGTINLQGNVEINNKEELSFIGIESTEDAGFYSKTEPASITFTNCNDINIKGINFTFVSESRKPVMLTFINCRNIQISNCHFNGNCNYVLWFDKACRDIMLSQNEFTGYQEYGINLYNESNFTIKGNQFYYGNGYSASRMIWIADIIKPDINDLRFDESVISMSENWGFDSDNYESMEFKGEEIGAYISYCEDIGYRFNIYENLTRSFFRSLIDSDIEYSSNTLALLSGINPIAPSDSYSDQLVFSHINPEFVEWAANRINKNIVSEKFYNIVLKHFARLLCESYLYLNKQEIKAELINDYSVSVAKDEVPYFLRKRFNNTLIHHLPNHSNGDDADISEDMSESAHMMGFWIRRMIDGSDKAFWDAAVKFMTIYDQEWIEEITKQYKHE